MGIADVLQNLTEGAYAAALDDRLWAQWTGQLITALGGAGGAFHVIDTERGIVHSDFRAEARVVDAYLDSGLADRDPQVPVVVSVRQSTIFLDTDNLYDADPATAEHQRWLAANARWGHHMTAVSLLGDGRLRGALSIYRHPDDGYTPDEEHRKLAAIFPAIGHAMQLGFQHGEN